MKRRVGLLALTLLFSLSIVLSACSSAGSSERTDEGGSGNGKVTLSF